MGANSSTRTDPNTLSDDDDSDFASHLVEQALGGDDANLEKDTETFENDPETFSKQPELDANVNDASVQQEEKTYEDESCNELLWVESSVKLMLSLYENCFLKVGHTVKLKTKKKMWENITTEMVQKGYKFTCAQIQNKFKTLERRYKGVIDNNNRTGRQKISCPYERELSNIFCKNPAVHPKYLLEAKEGVATSNSETEQVNFDHFQILRAIGKGSFGKVCIVQKRDTGRLFAMKYVSRNACESRGALGGVLKEVELLSSLEHPFLVNLWFSFQDEEDLFMVCDLLTGGDLRYHLQQGVEFTEESVALLVCELGSALDYLQIQNVVHRDIKPDNILLDDDGHAHLTDFNIATRLNKDTLACSMSGTKPYMAPEVFSCALDEIAGYSFPVDWWSLGVVAYEMKSGMRPFIVHSHTALVDVKNTLYSSVHYPRNWSNDFIDLLTKLLNVVPGGRLSSLRELRQTPLLRKVDLKSVLKKRVKPPFRPPEDHLNCDPCLELEEMIVETKPLHKKKKRLAKQRSTQRDTTEINLIKEFIVYNRYKELKKKAMEQKENEWQKELDHLMASSVVNALVPIKQDPKDLISSKAFDISESIAGATGKLKLNEICSKSTNSTSKLTNKSKDNVAGCSKALDESSIEYIDNTPPSQLSTNT